MQCACVHGGRVNRARAPPCRGLQELAGVRAGVRAASCEAPRGAPAARVRRVVVIYSPGSWRQHRLSPPAAPRRSPRSPWAARCPPGSRAGRPRHQRPLPLRPRAVLWPAAAGAAPDSAPHPGKQVRGERGPTVSCQIGCKPVSTGPALPGASAPLHCLPATTWLPIKLPGRVSSQIAAPLGCRSMWRRRRRCTRVRPALRARKQGAAKRGACCCAGHPRCTKQPQTNEGRGGGAAALGGPAAAGGRAAASRPLGARRLTLATGRRWRAVCAAGTYT